MLGSPDVIVAEILSQDRLLNVRLIEVRKRADPLLRVTKRQEKAEVHTFLLRQANRWDKGPSLQRIAQNAPQNVLGVKIRFGDLPRSSAMSFVLSIHHRESLGG